jgi:hypothetical protein
MKILFLLATVTALVDVTSAAQAEPPTFELNGFPITQHQVAVLGGTGIQEQSRTPMLTLGDMPASPHQVAVLTPRASLPVAPSITELSIARVSAP